MNVEHFTATLAEKDDDIGEIISNTKALMTNLRETSEKIEEIAVAVGEQRDEISFAIDCDKPVIPILLEQVTLPPGWQLTIGSLQHIAGICNQEGNVLGLMPHPERACDPLIGKEDGKNVFQSLMDWMNK